MVKVIAYRAGQEPVVEDIPDTLEAMQELVGGYIEGLTIEHTPDGEGLQIICNETGKLNGLTPVAFVPKYQDVICGDFLVSRHDNEGETVDVTEADVQKAREMIRGVL